MQTICVLRFKINTLYFSFAQVMQNGVQLHMSETHKHTHTYLCMLAHMYVYLI